jgi:hypothetical protein
MMRPSCSVISVKDASGMAIDAGGAAMEELRRAVGAG